MFFVFASIHGPCFSTSNLLWNYCRFCKWRFLSLVHLTCNKFNVHGVAHMKHVPSMSPLHPKKKPFSNRPFPPTNGGCMDLLCFVTFFYNKKGNDIYNLNKLGPNKCECFGLQISCACSGCLSLTMNILLTLCSHVNSLLNQTMKRKAQKGEKKLVIVARKVLLQFGWQWQWWQQLCCHYYCCFPTFIN